MMFLAVLLILTLLFSVPALLQSRSWDPVVAMRWALAAALCFFGVDHLLSPERYLPMMPGLLPMPKFLVLFTGLCEIAGGIGLLLPRVRRLAGLMLALYFLAVFPANIRNALYGLDTAGVPSADWYLWLRLLFQPLFIGWALVAGDRLQLPRIARSKASKPA